MQLRACAATIDSFTQENMINSSNRLLKKSGRKIKSDEKGQNMVSKPKRLRSTKDMTRDFGSAITMHIYGQRARIYMYISNNNNTIAQPT